MPDDGLGGGACDHPGVDCSARITRLGVQAFCTMNQLGAQLVPWLGAGIGYERASVKAEDDTGELELGLSGLELLNLQVGGDFKLGERLAVDPYLLFGIARCSDGELEMTGLGSGDLDMDETIHEWCSFGVRGKLDLQPRARHVRDRRPSRGAAVPFRRGSCEVP